MYLNMSLIVDNSFKTNSIIFVDLGKAFITDNDRGHM